MLNFVRFATLPTISADICAIRTMSGTLAARMLRDRKVNEYLRWLQGGHSNDPVLSQNPGRNSSEFRRRITEAQGLQFHVTEKLENASHSKVIVWLSVTFNNK